MPDNETAQVQKLRSRGFCFVFMLLQKEGILLLYIRSVLLVLFGSCSYGILSTIVKLAYAKGYTPAHVTGGQTLFGAIMMWLAAILLSRSKPTARQWLVFLPAGLSFGLTSIFYYQSVQYVPASFAIILLFQFTWIGVLAESVMARRWPDRSRWAALLLLAVGTILAGGVIEEGAEQWNVRGIVFGLLSAVTYTSFIIISSKTSKADPIARSAILLTGAAVLSFIVYGPGMLIDGSLGQGLLPYALLLAFFGAFIPTLFFTLGIPHIGPGLATILGAAELPTVVLLSTLVLREKVTLWNWIGVVVILIGIAIPEAYRLFQRRRTASEQV